MKTMPNALAIRVEEVGKRYFLGRSVPGQGGLRHLIEEIVTRPAEMVRRKEPGPDTGEFWALRNVSFEVKRGEVVGIIGRNGAGKSTLLKILSRITEPTTGRVGINGRVASLLEVGTGFHQELTGRENIFLNGAILGMRQSEVRRKLDEIVAFAGVEKFLETPVKRYSSGMHVRLAFAVAAHLESEVLIIDEVLAVGDAEFQKKCLGKMQQVTDEGRTVIFVSHDFAAVSALCRRGILLKSGSIAFQGSAQETLAFYAKEIADAASRSSSPEDINRRKGSGTHRIEWVRPAAEEFPARGSLSFLTAIQRRRDDGVFYLALDFLDDTGRRVFVVTTEYLDNRVSHAGDQEIEIAIDSPWLPPGSYRVDANLYSVTGILDLFENACQFRIAPDVAKNGYSSFSARQCGQVLAAFRADVRPLGRDR